MPTGIRETLLAIPPLDDPNVAEGVNLDVTADLVGQSRVFGDGLVASDPEFRVLIGARITRNSARVATADYLQTLADFFDAVVRVSLDTGMTFGYVVMREPTAEEIAVLNEDIVARPMGVKVIRAFAATDYFGYLEDPDASGYDVGHYVEEF